jgi:hypothetical protein
MSESKDQLRTSLYLTRKAEALLGALRFFHESGGGSDTALQRRLEFLAQSDFWEWEIDNLIYSFTNFQERSKTWQSAAHATAKLGSLGIVIHAKVAQKVKWKGRWQVDARTRRVAPIEMLREVVELWNLLVDAAEAQFVSPMRGQAERWSIRALTSLRHMRKAMPSIEQ